MSSTTARWLGIEKNECELYLHQWDLMVQKAEEEEEKYLVLNDIMLSCMLFNTSLCLLLKISRKTRKGHCLQLTTTFKKCVCLLFFNHCRQFPKDQSFMRFEGPSIIHFRAIICLALTRSFFARFINWYLKMFGTCRCHPQVTSDSEISVFSLTDSNAIINSTLFLTLDSTAVVTFFSHIAEPLFDVSLFSLHVTLKQHF